MQFREVPIKGAENEVGDEDHYEQGGDSGKHDYCPLSWKYLPRNPNIAAVSRSDASLDQSDRYRAYPAAR